MKNVYGDLVVVLVQAEGIDSKPVSKLKTLCSRNFQNVKLRLDFVEI